MAITNVPFILYPQQRLYASSYNATLDAADEFIVAVFRVPRTGTLSKIGWYCTTVTGSSYTLKISIESVAESIGAPVATTNALKTLFSSGSESADLTSLSSATMYYTAINGTSGVSVTAGDLIAVTFRLTAVSGSSLSIRYGQYTPSGAVLAASAGQDPYSATYLSAAWTLIAAMPSIVLEYSDGFAPCPHLSLPNRASTTLSWGNNDSPNRRGMKFVAPYTCRLSGVVIGLLDVDDSVDVILYDSDGYTVMSGFPITLNSNKRRANAAGDYTIFFPTKPTLTAGSSYRLVLLPSSTTDIATTSYYGVDDGSYSWMSILPEGTNWVYTSRNGAPSSGDAAWTDSTTNKLDWVLLIDGIDLGSSGGMLRHPGMQGGLNA